VGVWGVSDISLYLKGRKRQEEEEEEEEIKGGGKKTGKPFADACIFKSHWN